MSSTATTLRIDMTAAINEICSAEGTCYVSNNSSNSGLTSGFSRLFASSPTRVSHPRSSQIAAYPENSLAFNKLTEDDFEPLQSRIKSLLDNNLCPTAYRSALVEPFYNILQSKSISWFRLQLETPNREIECVAHSILQNFDPDATRPIPFENIKALREVISDLYQTFLQKKCATGASIGCKKISSPAPNLYDDGLSTFSHPLRSLGTKVSIVNFPTWYAKKSAVLWGCLGHEVLGHDILAAYDSALPELQLEVGTALAKQGLAHMVNYWTLWLEESAADILSVLNLGPASAFSLIAFLRAFTPGASASDYKLSPIGYFNDVHPLDLARGFLVAYATQELASKGSFPGAQTYAQGVMEQVNRDAQGIETVSLETKLYADHNEAADHLIRFFNENRLPIPMGLKGPFRTHEGVTDILLTTSNTPRLNGDFLRFLRLDKTHHTAQRANDIYQKSIEPIGVGVSIRLKDIKKSVEPISIGVSISLGDIKKSAQIVARTIFAAKLDALDGQSFSDIKMWNRADEKASRVFRSLINLELADDPVEKYKEGHYAAHVVSAAIMESITSSDDANEPKDLNRIFQRMITILTTMHQTNLEWQLPAAEKTNSSSSPSSSSSSSPSSSSSSSSSPSSSSSSSSNDRSSGLISRSSDACRRMLINNFAKGKRF